MTTHRPGINEGFLVNRKVKLTGLTANNTAEIKPLINEIVGVDSIHLQVESMLMRVSYDASLTDMETLLKILSNHEVFPHSGWWTQYKLKWDRQVDLNIRDNAKHQPHCCSKPPPGK